MNDISYYVRSIAQKLFSLKSRKRLNISDQEIIDEILDTDIPLIQAQLQDEHKAKDITR